MSGSTAENLPEDVCCKEIPNAISGQDSRQDSSDSVTCRALAEQALFSSVARRVLMGLHYEEPRRSQIHCIDYIDGSGPPIILWPPILTTATALTSGPSV
jgi:hypothetical protein